MVSLTLSISEDLKKSMDKFEDVNWSGFVRKCINEKTALLQWKDNMLKKLDEEKAFNEWAVKICRQGRKGRFEELRKNGYVK